MDCERIEAEEIIEKYLTGKLDEARQKAFEDHYFGCSRCRERVMAVRTLQEELWEQREAILDAAPEKRLIGIRRWAWAPVAATALIVISVFLWRPWRGSPRPAPLSKTTASSLALLAQFEPPPYLAPALRGAADEAAELFQNGMKEYQKGDFGLAIPGLEAAAKRNPKAANVRFFLGICLLLTGKTDAGSHELEAVIALGDSAYLEEAHFYLAKAHLREGNIEGARAELETVAKSQGRFAEEASRLLTQLR